MKVQKFLIFLSIIFVDLIATPTYASETGEIKVSTGIGIISSWSIGADESLIPPVVIKSEYTLRNDIGPGSIAIGGHFSYDSYKKTYISTTNATYGWKQSRTILGLTGTYSYRPLTKLEVYGKLMIGWRFAKYNLTGEWPETIDPKPGVSGLKKSGVTGAVGIGSRYYIVDRIALFGELGYDVSYFIFGVSFNLN